MLFSNNPGRHERDLQRRYNNPLFQESVIDQQDVHFAQQKDEHAIDLFMAEFKKLAQRTIALNSNVDADIMLKLKEDFDKLYEQCAGLANDQSELKEMIKRLLQTIMKSMWGGIGNDPQAKEKLEMEEQARAAHFSLLESPLIADLLHPESLIAADELSATLLSSNIKELDSALSIFDSDQLTIILEDSIKLIEPLKNDSSLKDKFDEKIKMILQAVQRHQHMPQQ